MTPRLTAETFCFAPAQTLAIDIGVTVDGKVVVGRQLHHQAGVPCTGVAHKARAALSGLRAQWAAASCFMGPRRCRIRAASSAGRRGRPETIFFNRTCTTLELSNANVLPSKMTHVQRAGRTQS